MNLHRNLCYKNDNGKSKRKTQERLKDDLFQLGLSISIFLSLKEKDVFFHDGNMKLAPLFKMLTARQEFKASLIQTEVDLFYVLLGLHIGIVASSQIVI